MPASQEEIYQNAASYIDAGLEVIPNDPKFKFPKGIPNWQTVTFTKEDLREYIVDKGYVIGVRNIEGLDFDNHGSPSAKEMISDWANILKESYPDLLEKLLVESTPSGGFHVVWKCEVIEGNTKLASRACTSEELESNPDVKSYTLIETRGKGGQFMVAPSPGYKLLRGSWTNLPIITQEERLALIMSAIMLDKMPANLVNPVQKKILSDPTGDRPGDMYNDDPDLVSQTLPLLLEHGWLVVFEREGIYFLRRPGKVEGISATLNHVAPGVFYNFSANASPFELNSGYSPFAVYTMLKHEGDYNQAIATLTYNWDQEGPFVNPECLEKLRERETKKKPPAQSAEDFGVIRGDELLDIELPEEEWLISKIIPATGFCLFVAAAGSWKTFLTLSLAQSLVTGSNWLGQQMFETHGKHKVLFIDKENALSLIQRRIKGLGFDKEMGSRLGWLRYPEKLRLTEQKNGGVILTDFMNSLSELVKAEDYRVIVVDSFVDLMVGDENRAGDTQTFFDALRTAFPNKAIIVLHHENKPVQGFSRTGKDRTRGNTNINAQASAVFRVEPLSGSKTDIAISNTKARSSQEIDKFHVKVEVEVVDEEKHVTVVRGFKYVSAMEDTETSSRPQRAGDVIVEALSEAPSLNRQQIIDACTGLGMSIPTVERALKTLVDDRIITRLREGRASIYYLVESLGNE